MTVLINGPVETPPLRYVPRVKKPKTGGAESEYGPFVASKQRQTFHSPNCERAAEINPGNRLEFVSHSEAVEVGLKPCKTCRA